MKGYASSMTALLTSVLLVLAGCGLDSSGNQTSEGGMGGSGSGPGDVAEGGIGGSGSGTTTGYGSIYINDYRYYQIAEDAIVRLDGELITPTTINGTGQGLPLGLVVDFLLDESANAELTTGTVIEMEANHRMIGPITSLNPLRILGQSVRVDRTTLFDGVDLNDFELGALIKAAGLEDSIGFIRASRLAAAADEAQWQLIGRITDMEGLTFKVGLQAIDLGTSNPTMECDGPLGNGQSVLLKATPQSPFLAGDPLNGVTLVRCLEDGLNLFGRQVAETLPATTDGFIISVLQSSSEGPALINLGGQIVDLTQVLPVLVSTLAQLEVGSRLEVDGVLNTNTGVLLARRVRLKNELALIQIIAPITAIGSGEITILGQPVVALPQTLGDLYDDFAVGDTVKVIGFISDASLYAVAAFAADAGTVELRGPVTGISEDGNTLMLADVPFPMDSADSVTLLDAVGEVVELVNGVCQTILSLLCPAKEEPPELVGTLATLINSSFTDSNLHGGDLLLQEPTE
jgi:hypothetical protein